MEYRKLGIELNNNLDILRVWKDGQVYHTKGLVDSIGDLKIYIYPNDHNPPHFHVISKQRNIDARFSMETLDLINIKFGKISSDDLKKIKYYFLEYRPHKLDFLRSEYMRLNK